MLTTDIKRKIDSARDILVGKVPDPKAQVDQITNALIYKFMDDMDQEVIDLGGKPQFFNNGYEKYSWSKLMDPKLGGADRLDRYVEAVAQLSQNPHIPQLFRDIFKDAYLPYRDPETLSLFLKQINEFTYHHSEELGNSFEYLLSVLGSQGDAGQFRTPRHIIDFIVSVVDPKKTDRILDPACGTAGFLISAYKHILNSHDGKDEGGKPNEEISLTPDERKRLASSITGYDISPDMVKLSRVNMYLHGFPEPHIYEYDSLTRDDRWDDSFDVILANPPFMTPKGGIRPHKRFSVQTNRAEVLFVDYILEHLATDGRTGIVLPDGVLTRPGTSFAKVRRQLLSNGLYAVVDLPRGVFQPYSKVKTSILFIDKKMKKDELLFAFIKPVSDQKSVEINQFTELNISEIRSLLTSYKASSDLPQRSKLVKVEDILSSKESVLHSEYYDEAHNKNDFMELGDILERVSIKVGDMQDVNIMSVTMKNGLVDQSDKFNKRIANKDISNYKLVRRNELVVGFPIDEGVLGFQTKHEYAAVSPAYDIWKLKKDIPVNYLERVLRSPQAVSIYRQKMKGTANRRRVVPKDVFLKISIPVPKNVDAISAHLKILENEIEDLQKKILYKEARINNTISETWDK